MHRTCMPEARLCPAAAPAQHALASGRTPFNQPNQPAGVAIAVKVSLLTLSRSPRAGGAILRGPFCGFSPARAWLNTQLLCNVGQGALASEARARFGLRGSRPGPMRPAFDDERLRRQHRARARGRGNLRAQAPLLAAARGARPAPSRPAVQPPAVQRTLLEQARRRTGQARGPPPVEDLPPLITLPEGGSSATGGRGRGARRAGAHEAYSNHRARFSAALEYELEVEQAEQAAKAAWPRERLQAEGEARRRGRRQRERLEEGRKTRVLGCFLLSLRQEIYCFSTPRPPALTI